MHLTLTLLLMMLVVSIVLGVAIYKDFTWTNHFVYSPTARDVSYNELKAFLASDTTENHRYIAGIYDCKDFTTELFKKAHIANIRSGWVVTLDGRHTFNVFNTLDKGIVFVDATKGDAIFSVREGNYIVEFDTPDDMIEQHRWQVIGKARGLEIKWQDAMIGAIK